MRKLHVEFPQSVKAIYNDVTKSVIVEYPEDFKLDDLKTKMKVSLKNDEKTPNNLNESLYIVSKEDDILHSYKIIDFKE